jgi:BASS family bile acid:Na+ symporter
MPKIDKLLRIISIILAVTAVALLLLVSNKIWASSFGILAMASLTIGGRNKPSIRQHAFTIWVIIAVALGMTFPQFFQQIGSFKLTKLIVPFIQLIMFSMGTEMSLKDFEAVIKSPKAVLLGLICHFTIMPLLGLLLATSFGFEPEIAAGIILMGSVPSGVTSNVLAFIAKANMPLSVTIATVSTLVAPLATPFLMKLLAGQYISIDFWAMMLHVVEIIIVPIVLGLVFNKLIREKLQWLKKLMPILSVCGVFMVVLLIVASGRNALLSIGPLLFVASMIHHTSGYFLGYWSGRLLGFDEATARTISLEVGMQNAGLASGIALQMGKIATVGLASAIAAPWMTISGSVLANWWRNKNSVDPSPKP